ncbi:DUF3089 domain-containing protein [Alkalihalobacillus macyae]|uniref:DUF3089 domain-containing protein n=1 Tax=Guptibacillus hwajinpoensis TaxID=208199 RepID=UPI00273C5A37|nr:DUF3089 domain-containing protein [Alkalihalobacillus macyae]MDP4552753.1 DUF3089 domain-containing protein [Alkalihalobacillus macyae]
MNFANLQKHVSELVQEKRSDEALSLMEDAKKDFPNKIDRLGHWKANLYSIEGKKEEALAELNEVLANGLWWNPELLTSDPELDILKDSTEFKNIVNTCQSIFEKEKVAAQAEWNVLGNPLSDTVIFPLHWKGSNLVDFTMQWSEEKLVSNYLLGIPQSSQLFSYACYSWDDKDIASTDVRTTFREFEKNYNLYDKEVILSGASQGANVATQLSLHSDVEEFNEFIAIAPAFEINELENIITTNLNGKVRGCIITGDKDPFYKSVLKAVTLFETYQIPFKLIVIQGMGHTLPDDLADVMEQAVNFVKNKEPKEIIGSVDTTIK